MQKAPLVSALVLNYRNPWATVACVKSLLQQTIARDLEILVIDNHSDDDSIGILRNSLRSLPSVRIIETRSNDGFGSGYNAGARAASGMYLLINNPDKRLQPDGIKRMMDRLEKEPAVGIIGPKMLHPDGSRRLSMRTDPRLISILSRRSFLGRIFPAKLRDYLMLDANPETEQVVDWVVGGSFLIARKFFGDLGGFDERFFLFFEDSDLCRRCRLARKKVLYFPEVSAEDKRRRLSGETIKDLFFTTVGRIHIFSAIKYFMKWGWL